MLTYDQALAKVLDECSRISPAIETVDLDKAAFRVLAEDLKAPFDLPRFNNSAVDGFGVNASDLTNASQANPVTLSLMATVPAGADAQASGITGEAALPAGSCIKILTGAPVPETVEAVVMREFCQEVDGKVIVTCTARIGENIRLTGEELEEGRVVLAPGTRLTPPAIGLVATVGASQVKCFRQPRIALVSTGDELIEPGQTLLPWQIHNSNSYALSAALTGLHISPESITRYHCLDSEESVKATLSQALADCDVLITLGGVSVGDRDYVKSTLEQMDARTVFWKASIKPGKPIYFATMADKKVIFGLPGNPVSALVTFHLFVKPALLLLQGTKCNATPEVVTARLSNSLKKKAGRLDFVRAIVSRNKDGQVQAKPTTGQDSHMLTGLTTANALIHFEQELEYRAEGDTVDVQFLNWSN